jgi:hypothetical protein
VGDRRPPERVPIPALDGSGWPEKALILSATVATLFRPRELPAQTPCSRRRSSPHGAAAGALNAAMEFRSALFYSDAPLRVR